MKFSLLVPTLNRSQEIKCLFESLLLSTESSFEVIVVDQSSDNETFNVVSMFPQLDIKYIKSSRRGLSYNRNIALSNMKGDYYCFPDDDCVFYPDTLSVVSNTLAEDCVDFVLGRIFCREKKKNIIRKWPSTYRAVNQMNFYFLTSSITMFFKNKCSCVFFDENLGSGAKYGACEDPDYIFQMLLMGYHGVYSPSVEVWHPEQSQKTNTIEKITSYASGFGYFLQKDIGLSKIRLLILYILNKTFSLFTLRISLFQYKAIVLGISYGFRKGH